MCPSWGDLQAGNAGMGQRKGKLPGLCPDLQSWEERGSSPFHQPVPALVWGSVPGRSRTEAPAMPGTVS